MSYATGTTFIMYIELYGTSNSKMTSFQIFGRFSGLKCPQHLQNQSTDGFITGEDCRINGEIRSVTIIAQSNAMTFIMNAELIANILFFISSTCSTVLSLVVIYMVCFHSPQSMSGYRRFVVNFTCWDFLFCLSLGYLVKPELIFPYDGFYINGLFKYFGDSGAKLSFVFLINTACHMLSTQVYCLFFRYAILQTSPRFLEFTLSWKTWIRGWIIAFAISSSAGFFIFAPIQKSQAEVRNEIIALSHQFGDPQLPDFSRLILYISPNTDKIVYAGVFVFVGFFIFEVVSISVVIVVLRQLEEKKASFSRETYRLHRQLTVALGVQLLTPFLHIVAPFTLFLLFNYPYGTMSYATGTLFIMYIELYGTSNSVITLYMVKPYRVYLKSKFMAFIRLITIGKYGNEPEPIMVMAPESTLNTFMP